MVNGVDTPVHPGRLPVPGVEADETMPAITLRRAQAGRVPQLEKALLRRSVGERETLRHRCAHCERTPLTGEVVHLYATAAGDRLVCDLCRPLRREAPARSELMHAPEHERSVRLMRRAA
jgi:hypothetical protein